MAFGEDPVGQILLRCASLCIGPVWMTVWTTGQKVFPELRFLWRFKVNKFQAHIETAATATLLRPFLAQ